jgi:TRAP-type mannitol/chloroaromatic compound transport system permease small subunit
MMAGAYTLPRTGTCAATCSTASSRRALQAWLDLILFVCFFIPAWSPGWAGYIYAAESWAINEHSNITSEGPPIYPSRPSSARGASILLQGVVEIMRCIVCIKQGDWPSREEDVEEVDVDKLKKMVQREGRGHRRLDPSSSAKRDAK